MTRPTDAGEWTTVAGTLVLGVLVGALAAVTNRDRRRRLRTRPRRREPR